MVLFAIPVATFGEVDRESEVEAVAGAHDLESHGSTLIMLCSRKVVHCYTRCVWPIIVVLE